MNKWSKRVLITLFLLLYYIEFLMPLSCAIGPNPTPAYREDMVLRGVVLVIWVTVSVILSRQVSLKGSVLIIVLSFGLSLFYGAGAVFLFQNNWQEMMQDNCKAFVTAAFVSGIVNGTIVCIELLMRTARNREHAIGTPTTTTET